LKDVAVVGVGLHRFGRFPNQTIEEIGQEAVIKALKDANNLDWKKVQVAYCGSMHGGTAIGQRVLARIGLTGIPIINVETACASGGSSLELAVQAVASGQYELSLALGIEKEGRGFLPMTSYPMWEHLSGLGMPPVQLALRATRYMIDYGAKLEHFARVVVKSRKNGSLNPNAMHQKTSTLERVLNTRMVSYPLNLSMLTTPCEGAAAIIVSSVSEAKKYNDKPIFISAICSGVAQYGTTFCGMSAGFESDSIKFRQPEITTVLSQRAYQISGIAPEELDVLECNDNTAASEIILLEELGLCKPGEGIRFIEERRTEIGGDIAVNPSGGLISMGEPVGAVGTAQVHEVVQQLRGQAGQRQVPNVKSGLCQSAGAGGNCTVAILKN
jgi:acetyl-CoA acetyltransferase